MDGSQFLRQRCPVRARALLVRGGTPGRLNSKRTNKQTNPISVDVLYLQSDLNTTVPLRGYSHQWEAFHWSTLQIRKPGNDVMYP